MIEIESIPFCIACSSGQGNQGGCRVGYQLDVSHWEPLPADGLYRSVQKNPRIVAVERLMFSTPIWREYPVEIGAPVAAAAPFLLMVKSLCAEPHACEVRSPHEVAEKSYKIPDSCSFFTAPRQVSKLT